MSTPVEELILKVLSAECPGSCPYRFGDSQGIRVKLEKKLADKLKHRVADGNEVRVLTKRVEVLENAIRDTVTKLKSRKISTEDVRNLEQLLKR